MRFGFLTIAVLMLSTAAMTKPVQRLPPAPKLALDHVGIQAIDLSRSVIFYTQILGLREVSAPFPKAAARWLSLGDGHMLHIVAGGKADAQHNPWDHFALACSNLDAMIARLNELKVPWTDMNGRQVT